MKGVARLSQLLGQYPFLLPWGEEGDREVTWGCASLGVCRESPLDGCVLSRGKADTGTWTMHSGVQVPLTAVDAAAWWDLEAAGKVDLMCMGHCTYNMRGFRVESLAATDLILHIQNVLWKPLLAVALCFNVLHELPEMVVVPNRNHL